MSAAQDPIAIQLIPVDQIAVINPRVRSKKKFQDIVDSIAKVGLKRPITVSRRNSRHNDRPYQLVCGQGRLEAFISLDEPEIPAVVVSVTEEDSLIMSLVENLARRSHSPLELMREIGELGKRGYSDSQIAKKTGLSYKYAHSIRYLINEGEERLLSAVERGLIPINVAIEIAEADDEGAQMALAQAYQDGHLRGKKLLMARRLIEQRTRRGKGIVRGRNFNALTHLSSEALVRAYEQEADRQRLMIKKSEVTQSRLLFIVEAMRRLLADENFVTLLRAEGLETMPQPLADLVSAGSP